MTQPVVKGLSNQLSNGFDNPRLTTGCIVYTNIQPVVKPVWQPYWQPAVSCIGCIVYTACCQTGCTTRFDNRLNEQPLFVQPVVKPVVINTVVKPAVKRVWQPVGCLFTRYSRLSNRFYNRLDNRLYRVNGVWRLTRRKWLERGIRSNVPSALLYLPT